MTPISDEQLMLRYRDGDARAFPPLYQRHHGALYRYLLHGCGHPATTEELFQDVWTGLIKARAGYRVEASFSTWLYRLAHNRLVDHYRRTRGTWVDDASLPELPDPAPGQEQLANDADCVDRLQTALGRLPSARPFCCARRRN